MGARVEIGRMRCLFIQSRFDWVNGRESYFWSLVSRNGRDQVAGHVK